MSVLYIRSNEALLYPQVFWRARGKSFPFLLHSCNRLLFFPSFFVQGESASPKKVIIKDQTIGESQTVTPHSAGFEERTGESKGSLQITNERFGSLRNCGSMWVGK